MSDNPLHPSIRTLLKRFHEICINNLSGLDDINKIAAELSLQFIKEISDGQPPQAVFNQIKAKTGPKPTDTQLRHVIYAVSVEYYRELELNNNYESIYGIVKKHKKVSYKTLKPAHLRYKKFAKEFLEIYKRLPAHKSTLEEFATRDNKNIFKEIPYLYNVLEDFGLKFALAEYVNILHNRLYFRGPTLRNLYLPISK